MPHPHMRGEYPFALLPPVRTSGSSPHAWGILGAVAGCAAPGRFIPTCVGNTWCISQPASRLPAHPHMRGEYTCNAITAWAMLGSSPHAWGIRPIKRTKNNGYSVHPHMRGEYFADDPTTLVRAGSSPHAWGIPVPKAQARPCCRFIPTCVGNTMWSASRTGCSTVHPHMRGEYAVHPIRRGHAAGSSPHAWGIRHRKNRKTVSLRFIPTCVGNTVTARV